MMSEALAASMVLRGRAGTIQGTKAPAMVFEPPPTCVINLFTFLVNL